VIQGHRGGNVTDRRSQKAAVRHGRLCELKIAETKVMYGMIGQVGHRVPLGVADQDHRGKNVADQPGEKAAIRHFRLDQLNAADHPVRFGVADLHVHLRDDVARLLLRDGVARQVRLTAAAMPVLHRL